LQVSIFVFLIVGLMVKRKRKITTHARLMLAAVILNLVSFSAIIAPAWDNVGEGGVGGLSTVGMLHVGFGRFHDACQLLGFRHLACAVATYAKC
jgi:hypothetical protein